MDDPSRRVLEKLYAGDRHGALEASAGQSLDVFAAAALGDAERVRLLLQTDRGAVEARTDDGFTALHLGAYFGTREVVETLLAGGADPASVAGNASAVTPLHSAVAHRDPGIAAALLEAGSPVDARQSGGYAALHSAALHGEREIVRLLLAHGADPQLTDDAGSSARDYAMRGGHLELAEQLTDGSIDGKR